jgi:hypothetical protein
MTPMIEAEYMAIPDKTAVGTPSKYYYERHPDVGYLYLNYVPVDTNDTIVMKILRVLEDFDAVGNTPDFPQEWYRPLVKHLAIDLAPSNHKTVSKDLEKAAQEALFLANTFAPETTMAYFQPGKDD